MQVTYIVSICRSHHQKFNPFTEAGQKRGKRGRKRTGWSGEYHFYRSLTSEGKIISKGTGNRKRIRFLE